MDRERIYKELVDKGLTHRGIAEELKIAQSTVVWWLRKYNLSTRAARIVWNTECQICSKDMGDNPKNMKLCGGCRVRIRRFLTKQKAVKLLGGKCIRCGYDGNQAALEFHHLGGKDFNLGTEIGIKSWSKIKEELQKCELLCSNCHRIEHSKRDEETFILASKEYKWMADE